MSTPPLLPRPPGASRRAVLGTAIACLGLTSTAVVGCDDSRNDTPASSGVSGPGSAASGGGDGDDAVLVETVQQQLRRTEVLVAQAAAAFPVLAAALRPLRRLHAGHLAALAGGSSSPADPSPADPDAGPAGGDATAALGAVRVREQRLHRALVDAAVAADSGSLARLLASMSAGLTQALVELPSTPPAARRA